MSKIQTLIDERQMPALLVTKRGKKVKTRRDYEARREEIKKILMEKEYGVIPEKPEKMEVEVLSENERFCAGKATLKTLNFKFENDGKEFSFTAFSVIPKSGKKVPAFVHINFRPDVPDQYMPTEEIVDRGYAIFSFCYKSVALDNNDFKSNCAKYLCKNRRAKNAPGKIAMWAWAAMRVMDYICTLDAIDSNNVAIIGHSRLGKTALVTGGFDERFKFVISNDSGCSGAAISRGKVGESVKRITTVFPFWFCPRYVEGADDADNYDFDQNFLLGLTVPRHLLVGSAQNDTWADPTSEFLCTASINPAYEIYKMRGLVYEDEVPVAKAVLGEGDSFYHVRKGEHYLSREDWNEYMNYIDAHLD